MKSRRVLFARNFIGKHHRKETPMRPIALVGILLVIVGVAALLFGHFEYSDTKPVLKAGPLQVNATEQHSVDVPMIVGIVILVSGVGLLIAGRRGS
jgi:hypothetical protein